MFIDPTLRGFHVAYRQDTVNHCPGCGRTHWYIGRFSAECGFCATALPLLETAMIGSGTHSTAAAAIAASTALPPAPKLLRPAALARG